MLAAEREFEVVAEAEDGRTAVELAERLLPNVVVMDIGMPGLNGIEATRQIVERVPSVRVVALSAYADRRLIAEILKAGASGYLLKESAYDELAEAIRTAAAKKVYLSPRIAAELVDDYVRMSKDPGPSVFESLSPREREVLQLIAEGQSTKEVARILKVSVKTVETHRRQLMNKLELFSVAELTRYAIREGLVSLETRAGSPA
ncbi:MAG: two-component response regulator [Phycisphaerales bacterium]|nr:two-component response regulator [Phycisphaerales bacterium]